MEKSQDIRNQNDLSALVQLFEIATGFMKSQAIYVAAKLGIADLLLDGAKSIDELAEMTGTHSSSLYRLLRALASIGIFTEMNEGLFELTPMASALQSNIPMSLRPYVLLLGDPSWWNSWGSLFRSVKTGMATFDYLFGMNYDEYLEQHPDIGKIFHQCMSSVARANNPAIVNSYDFSCFRKVIDIGGGHGSLLAAILKKYPNATGVLFDLPHVIHLHAGYELEPKERSEMIGGDFFKSVPAGGDAYILKQIIHDWDDARSIQILKNCHKAMNENGRLLVIEAIIEPGITQSMNKFFDLHLLVTAPGAKEREYSEFRTLFNAAGFELLKIIPTPSSFSIIEGSRK